MHLDFSWDVFKNGVCFRNCNCFVNVFGSNEEIASDYFFAFIKWAYDFSFLNLKGEIEESSECELALTRD